MSPQIRPNQTDPSRRSRAGWITSADRRRDSMAADRELTDATETDCRIEEGITVATW
jgi:hypothetical protein